MLTTSRHIAALMLLVLLAGAGVRLWGIRDPVAVRQAGAWHEADSGAIARAYHREGANLFYPRIDWRRDGPGYVESELPLLPWTAALLYGVAGEHDVVLRVLAAAVSLGALVAFARLATTALSPPGALVAAAAFALSPLPVLFGNAVQPDGLMLLALVLAFGAVLRWMEDERLCTLLAAAAFTALAGVSKGPAVHFGVVLAAAVIAKRRGRAVRSPDAWAAAALAALPVVAWSAWAHQLWTDYGNSMGVSNETHWASPDPMQNLRAAVDIAKKQAHYVVGVAGAPLLLAGLLRRDRMALLAGAWLLGGIAFLLVIGRTSADDWAFYYHLLTAPPVALLLGAGFAAMWGPPEGARLPGWLARHAGGRKARLAALGLAVLCLGQLGLTGVRLMLKRDPDQRLHRVRQCTMSLAEQVPSDAKIVVDGGVPTDEEGNPVAFDRPMLFYYMDRRGFTVPAGSMSVETLREKRRRGASYYVAPAELGERQPALHDSLTERFSVVDACETHQLIALEGSE